MSNKKVPEGFHKHTNGGGTVQDTAHVEESVYVGPDARVFGDARVSGDAWVFSPLYIQGPRHALTNCKYGYIQIGCHCNTFAYWQKHYKAIGRAEGYTEEEIEQYGLFIQMFAKIGK